MKRTWLPDFGTIYYDIRQANGKWVLITIEDGYEHSVKCSSREDALDQLNAVYGY